MVHQVQWLLNELSAWEREGLVDAATGERLRERYKSGRGGARGAAVAAFAILGALLLGGGVILLLAHNWSDLSRTVRTALAVAPLAICAALALAGAARGAGGTAWRESVATVWTLSVGAAIAMVSQIYHLSGSFDGFMLTWVLLAVPIVYLMRSALAGALYLAGVLSWTCSQFAQDGLVLLYWPLTALMVPALVARWRTARFSPGTSFLLWVLGGSVVTGTSLTLAHALPGLWTVTHAALFSVLFLADRRWFEGAPSLWCRPLRVIGLLGCVVLALLFTYEWPWQAIGWQHYRHELPAWRQVTDAAFALGLAGWAAGLVVTRREVLRGATAFIALFPLAAFAAFALGTHVGREPAMLLFNLYVFALGLAGLVGGFRRSALGQVNAGMLLLGTLIALRFFDSDLNLLARGLIFVALGAAFLVVNVAMARRKGRTA